MNNLRKSAKRKQQMTADTLRSLLFYDCETGIFRWRPRPQSMFRNVRDHKIWTARYEGAIAGYQRPDGYVRIRVFGDLEFFAHRLAWLHMTGEWPVDEVDHKDGVKNHNAWANLREATHKENGRNRGATKRSKTGAKGVSWFGASRKFEAYIGVNGKKIHLGYFNTIGEAKEAYTAASHEFHGAFGRP